jgi:hypothetical protein
LLQQYQLVQVAEIKEIWKMSLFIRPFLRKLKLFKGELILVSLCRPPPDSPALDLASVIPALLVLSWRFLANFDASATTFYLCSLSASRNAFNTLTLLFNALAMLFHRSRALTMLSNNLECLLPVSQCILLTSDSLTATLLSQTSAFLSHCPFVSLAAFPVLAAALCSILMGIFVFPQPSLPASDRVFK